MTFARKLTWRDWFREMFVQQGMFSMRQLPTTQAERAEAATKDRVTPDMTRLDLEEKTSDVVR